MTFPDHFSQVASPYARFRPTYPAELFAELAVRAPAHDRAWDCGTGNGQAAWGLARHFAFVVATDASVSQLGQARARDGPPGGRVAFLAGAAERVPLAARSIALATVAQALHWFDADAFYGEVARVVRSGGLLAAWSYSLCHISPAVDRAVGALYHEALSDYWAPERRHVETGYRSLGFPFDEEPAPTGLTLRRPMTRADLEGYVATWSAVRTARSAGVDPIPAFLDELNGAWPEPDRALEARWPLSVRIGRVA